MTLEELSVVVTSKILPSLPGFVGAVISLRFFKADTWLERVAVVLSGWACAYFFTKPVVDRFSLGATQWADGTAFFIGLFGMAVVAALMGAIKDTKWGDILSGWVKK